ncbi:dethiobiotin synthase [Planctomicrobium sp. SH668]|uniref:dethiobiotin synthase n=1 Tax=Planctomicrobium sp. SH668 TaxID=3448126 RepID=UPI003F5CA746
MQELFITGIDTGVGKTHVTALLARKLQQDGHRVGVYKPACSGASLDGKSWSDLEILANATGNQYPLDWICPQRFLAPLAPPAAAELEGKKVDSGLLRSGVDVWKGNVDWLLVEGIGGWLCPIGEQQTIADLAVDLGFPVLVVAADRLGMINHTLLTLESIRNSGLPVTAAVVNRVSALDDGTGSSNVSLLQSLTSVSILGPLPFISGPDAMNEAESREILESIVNGLSS